MPPIRYSIDANWTPQQQNIIKNYAVSHQKLKNESHAIVFWLVTAVIFEYSGTEIHPTSFSNKETPSYKTSEKRLPLASSKMAEIINHQSLFIRQTIKRNDSLKTTRIGFWTSALYLVNLIIFNCSLEAIVVGRFSISWNMFMWVLQKNNIRKRQAEISPQFSPKHSNGILFFHYSFYLNTKGETVPIKKQKKTKTSKQQITVCHPQYGTFVPKFI